MDFSDDTPVLVSPKEYTIAFGHLKLIRDKSANGKIILICYLYLMSKEG